MTLGQAKRIVRFLLDSELFDNYEDKLNSYFDIGQKRIAATTDFLEKVKEVDIEAETELDLEAMDERFYKLRDVQGGDWEKLTPTRIRLQAGHYILKYCVYPAAITPHTSDAYEFEVSELAQTALPYYVAAQVTIAEHDLRYHQVYYDEFAAILENVHEAKTEGNMHILQMEV